MLTKIATYLRGLLQRRRVSREVDDELQFHLEMEAASNIQRGMSPTEAKRLASLDLGGVVRTREAIREVRALRVEAIWRDVRYALRGMKKKPAFTSLAVATLALGIGINVASVAVAYGILIRPLPYADPSRVVILNLLFADGSDLGFSPDTLQEWLPRFRTVDVAAGYYRREVTVRSGDHSAVIPAAVVTDRFFDVLGTRPVAGQTRIRIDSPEVVVGQGALDELLGRNATGSVGAILSVSDEIRSVGGVLPPDFAFPDEETGLWLPSAALKAGTKSEDSGYSRIIARLKPGVTIQQFRDDANRIRRELDPRSRETVAVSVLGEALVGGLRTLLIAVVVGALLVLVVASANVATLFIGRDVSRHRELAARMALGATRGQLVRSVVVETLLIALLASLAGIPLGTVTLRIFLAYASGVVSGLHRVVIGFPTVIAIAGLTLLVTLLCGAVPAWHAARTDVSPVLRARMDVGPRAWRVHKILVVAQIALCLVLLVAAGLLVRTVSTLMREDHGFRPDGALEAKLVLSDTVLFDGTGRETFVQDLLARVRAIPGVEHAGFGTNLPPRTPTITMNMRVESDGRSETRFLKVGSATPGYLRALGAQFIAGRDFEDGDGRSGAPVVIVSESFASFFFGHQDLIGRTIARLPAMFGITGTPRVIGVVRDMKYDGLDSPAGSAIYLPWAQRPLGTGYLIVRTGDGDPARLAPAIRQIVRQLDPGVPVPEAQSLEAAMAQSIAERRVRALPALAFGALALGIAFVGVLATLMTLVAERRHDFAIRSALGASPGRLVRMIVGRGLVLTVSGLVVGLAVSAAAARALSSLLYGVSPLDTMTFAGSALLIGAGAMFMTYLAARRAGHVDPLTVLRCE